MKSYFLIVCAAALIINNVSGQQQLPFPRPPTNPQNPPPRPPPPNVLQPLPPRQPNFPPGPQFPPQGPPVVQGGPNFGIFGPNFLPPEFNNIEPQIKYNPTYLIVASKMIRPGSVYRVLVNILQSEKPVIVRASISRDGVEVATMKQQIEANVAQHILLKVPPTSIPGNYKLRVEGNANGVTGGIIFRNETNLEFSTRFLTVLIQTNRPVYNRLQKVRFRIMMLTTDMKPYTEPVIVTILDPNNYVMRKWFSAHSNVGAVTLQFSLPSDPVQGEWTIRIVSHHQVEEKKFLVEKYWPARFEIDVQMPMYLLEKDHYITGVIQANYTQTYAPVLGNATICLSIMPSRFHYNTMGKSSPRCVIQQFIPWFNGSYPFIFSMDNLLREVPQLDGSEVKIEATIIDKAMDMKNTGYAQAKITNSSISLRFLGTGKKVFKPGMPFETYIAVSYHDLVPLPEIKLKNSRLDVSVHLYGRSGGGMPIKLDQQIPPSGVLKIAFDTYEDTTRLEIRAIYEDYERDRVEASVVAMPYFSRDRRFIHVYSSTTEPKIGEYMIFHLKNNFNMDKFSYVILAKGIIVASGTEEMDSVMQAIKTFAIPISSEMAPSCRVLVYHVTNDGEVLSDSLIVPIDVVSRHKINFELNPNKDKLGQTVELRVKGDPGAFFGVSVMDAHTFRTQAGNELSPASVSQTMHTFDRDHFHFNKVSWRSREGDPDKVNYFITSNSGADTNSTFTNIGLLVFTDANVTSRPDLCNEAMGSFPCLDGGCYTYSQKCNGRRECQNGFDEVDCVQYDEVSQNLKRFRLFRKNHIDRFYDPDFGDWAWINFNLAPEGDEVFSIGPVPRRPTNWILNAVSMSNEFGLGIIQQPYEFTGSRNFFITAEMPSICTRGEQIGVRVQVFNLQPFETYVLLVLVDSPHYRFVHVESEGVVKSYNPRTSSGDHQHLIWVKAHESFAVHLPFVPTHIGSFNVTVDAFTHVGRDRVVKPLTVEADGMLQHLHTSMLLDLKNQPTTLKFLKVNVTETPIVPYQKWRRFIFESPKAHVSVVGDIVGPAFMKMPVTADVLLRRPDRSAEMQVFNFAANLWNLHYLRLTNQLAVPQTKEAFKHLNIFYAWMMAYHNLDGSFSMWKDSNEDASVWLTQFAVRTLQQARFPDWEMYLYIDSKIIQQGIAWILKFQTSDGAFYDKIKHPFDRKMDPRAKKRDKVIVADNYYYTNVSLTAQVLITLCEVNDLPGTSRTDASNAKMKAVRYLEKILSSLDDPYELAITTYALSKAGSSDVGAGMDRLDGMKFEQEGKVYWAREEAPLTKIVMENQRPYIQPRLPQKYDAMNVEATSYALLVYIAQEGVIQESIVRWLNSMRTNDGGFISTQDTIIAMQALTEYTFRARVRDITDMTVNLESSATPGSEKRIVINQRNLAKLQTFEFRNVWGHVQATGHGAGLAILQLDLQYNIDQEFLIIQPPIPAFDLRVGATYYGKNSSIINITACQRWKLTEESKTSGAAVLELDVPTGYYQYQPDLDKIVESHRVRQLRRIKIKERRIYFYFSHLDTTETCVNFKLQRWFPVANLTQHMRARVYDYYAPERYNETLFTSINLYLLSICEVCGSYQCPFCPYFSEASGFQTSIIMTSVCLLISWLLQT